MKVLPAFYFASILGSISQPVLAQFQFDTLSYRCLWSHSVGMPCRDWIYGFRLNFHQDGTFTGKINYSYVLHFEHEQTLESEVNGSWEEKDGHLRITGLEKGLQNDTSEFGYVDRPVSREIDWIFSSLTPASGELSGMEVPGVLKFKSDVVLRCSGV